MSSRVESRNPALVVDPLMPHLIEVWRHSPTGVAEPYPEDDGARWLEEGGALLAPLPAKRRRRAARPPVARRQGAALGPVLLEVPEVAEILRTTPRARNPAKSRARAPTSRASTAS